MTGVSLQVRLEEATADLQRCQVAADVAEILRVEGVQGKRGDCESCPVATLLLKRLGPGVIVEVGDFRIVARLSEYLAPDARVESPPGVAAFIAEFDGDPEAVKPIRGGWDEFAVASP